MRTAPQGGREPGIGDVLDGLIGSSGATTALLITKDGVGVAAAGDTSYMSFTAMAALVAGMFSATREVARMVGEREFSILLQQGEHRHIQVSLVTDEHMMVVIFDGQQRIGLVRLAARKAAEQLAQALHRGRGAEEARGEISAPQFREHALHLIDSIFVTRGA